MSERVRISARLINWPGVCASCCRAADRTFAVSYTRSKGVKVVRSESKGWKIPYCGKCERWLELKDELDDDRAALERAESAVRTGEEYRDYGHPGWPTESIVVTMVAAILTLGIGGLVYFWLRHQHEQKCRDLVDAIPDNESLVADLASDIRHKAKECRALLPASERVYVEPARYFGWEGSVHTFEFDNPEFAEHFRAANAGKIIR